MSSLKPSLVSRPKNINQSKFEHELEAMGGNTVINKKSVKFVRNLDGGRFVEQESLQDEDVEMSDVYEETAPQASPMHEIIEISDDDSEDPAEDDIDAEHGTPTPQNPYVQLEQDMYTDGDDDDDDQPLYLAPGFDNDDDDDDDDPPLFLAAQMEDDDDDDDGPPMYIASGFVDQKMQDDIEASPPNTFNDTVLDGVTAKAPPTLFPSIAQHMHGVTAASSSTLGHGVAETLRGTTTVRRSTPLDGKADSMDGVTTGERTTAFSALPAPAPSDGPSSVKYIPRIKPIEAIHALTTTRMEATLTEDLETLQETVEQISAARKGKGKASAELEVTPELLDEEMIPLELIQHLLDFVAKKSDTSLFYKYGDAVELTGASFNTLKAMLGQKYQITRHTALDAAPKESRAPVPSGTPVDPALLTIPEALLDNVRRDVRMIQNVNYTISKAKEVPMVENVSLMEGSRYRMISKWKNPDNRHLPTKGRFDHYYDHVKKAERPDLPYKFDVNEDQIRAADAKIKQLPGDYKANLNLLRNARINQLNHELYQAKVLDEQHERVQDVINMISRYL